MIKMRIKNGMRSFLYRNPNNVVLIDNVLSFETSSICMGNHTTEEGIRCQRQFDESTYSGLENCIPNPILIKYEIVEDKYKTTRVTVNLSTPGIDGYEIVEELEDHEVSSESSGTFKCGKCDTLIEINGGQVNYKCPNCNKKYTSSPGPM